MRKAGKTRIICLVSSFLMIFSIISCSENKVAYPSRQMPAGLMSDRSSLQSGHELFLNKCAHCHGKPSEGRSDRAAFFKPAAPDFTDDHYKDMDPAFLYWRIEVGKTVEPYRSQGSVMPAWGVHFSDEQIWHIVAYLQSRAH